MKAYYSDHFVLPLPAGHRFPMAKYAMLRERVAAELPEVDLCEPAAARDGELALAHDPRYIERVTTGKLSRDEQRAVGFPWSSGLVERARRTTGATIEACRQALRDHVSVNLAGGTHHAHAAHGEGFCTFNDAAVAARLMQAESGRRRVSLPMAIVDLDVHQGNGTATIFQNDPAVCTLSLHGANNYPFRKASSSVDVALDDGIGDEAYLHALERALERLLACVRPRLIVYLAGADAHGDDRLGRLALSAAGLRARDQRVFRFAAECGAAIAVAMAGGYGRSLTTTVDVHFNTVRAALDSWRERRAHGAEVHRVDVG